MGRVFPTFSLTRFSSLHIQRNSPAAKRKACGKRKCALQGSTNTPAADFADSLKYDDRGLLVAIAQDIDTGEILMQAFANREAVEHTLSSGSILICIARATFYSRSRDSLWTKGEVSGNYIDVKKVFTDCDRDCLIYMSKPNGPSCHTGQHTCFFTPYTDQTAGSDEERVLSAARPSVYSLQSTIQDRMERLNSAKKDDLENLKDSWTAKLLTDPDLLCSKIREEADELCKTLEDREGVERVASEMADLLYHSIALLVKEGVSFEDAAAVLRNRTVRS